MTGDAPIDIYTKQPIEIRSDEHVLLNCLGGRLGSSELIDKATNDRFGETIDAALAGMVAFPRVVLGARSGDGKEPPPLKGLKTEEGTEVNLLPGGKPQLARSRIECVKEDGKLVIRGTARDMAELIRLTKRVREKHGIPLDAIRSGSTSAKNNVGLVRGEVEFGVDVARCICKMACNLLACSNKAAFLSPSFDPIRGFVLAGDGDARDFLRVNVRPISCQKPGQRLGELDHLILVRQDRRDGSVEATVCLYGHLPFAGHLGHTRERIEPTSYRVDQVALGARVNHPSDLKVATRKLRTLSSVGEAAELEAWSRAWKAVLGIVTERQHSNWRQRLFDECIEQTWGEPDGRTITEEMIERLAGCVAERFVTESAHFRHLRGDSRGRTRKRALEESE